MADHFDNQEQDFWEDVDSLMAFIDEEEKDIQSAEAEEQPREVCPQMEEKPTPEPEKTAVEPAPAPRQPPYEMPREACPVVSSGSQKGLVAALITFALIVAGELAAIAWVGVNFYQWMH